MQGHDVRDVGKLIHLVSLKSVLLPRGESIEWSILDCS